MKYGRAIRIVRTARGLSKVELAKRLSVGASYLSLIEAEKREPSVKVIDEISTVLRVPPHLMTLLASDATDLDGQPEEVANLAKSLLNLLVANDDQLGLPMEAQRRRRKTA